MPWDRPPGLSACLPVLFIKDSVLYAHHTRHRRVTERGVHHPAGPTADCRGGRFEIRARRRGESLPPGAWRGAHRAGLWLLGDVLRPVDEPRPLRPVLVGGRAVPAQAVRAKSEPDGA